MDEIEIIAFEDVREAKIKVIFHHKKVGYVEINPHRLNHEKTKLRWDKAIELNTFLSKCLDEKNSQTMSEVIG